MSDINELFSRDPLELTKDPEAIDAIIAAYRERRHTFKAGEIGGKKPAAGPKKLTKKEEQVKKLGLDLDLKL